MAHVLVVYLTFWFSQIRNIKYLLINQIVKQTEMKYVLTSLRKL